MNSRIYCLLFFLAPFLGCHSQKHSLVYESDQLKVERLTKNTFRHLSYLSTKDFAKVSCNGMIVIDEGEAVIFDTPTNESTSQELIEWVENTYNSRVIGVVVTHFHEDCLGGLNEFHQRQIPSYASLKTIEIARNERFPIPQKGFEKYLEIEIGDKKVINEFFGEGHTVDNIVSYFPDEEVLFGGCLVKAIGAGEGNLADANIDQWSKTVMGVQSKYGKAKVVIPGHGKPGNSELLDYTIELFKK